MAYVGLFYHTQTYRRHVLCKCVNVDKMHALSGRGDGHYKVRDRHVVRVKKVKKTLVPSRYELVNPFASFLGINATRLRLQLGARTSTRGPVTWLYAAIDPHMHTVL